MRTELPPIEVLEELARTRQPTKAPTPAVSVISIRAEKCRRSFKFFVQEFWEDLVPEPLVWGWHMDVFCEEFEKVVRRVVGTLIHLPGGRPPYRKRQPKEYDLVVNVPPGTTKSMIFTVMGPIWCWLLDPTLRFITGSYSGDLSAEHSDMARDLIKCQRFQLYFPDLHIRQDKDVKSNYHNNKRGSRFTTSTGGTVTGMHAHIIIIDDPLNPKKAASDIELRGAGIWMERTLSTRKIDKEVVPTILVMQRLAENDPSGMLLEKMKAGKKKIRHICLPGEIFNPKAAESVQPPELVEKYVDGMLDPVRINKDVLQELEADLGQYGYAGQIQQQPAPPDGGMFKVGKIEKVQRPPDPMIIQQLRYWDKAGTDAKDNPGSAHTAGVKIAYLSTGKYCIMDVVRGQWASEEREAKIKSIAELDGPKVPIWIEQEPGSGGKDSARSTIKNLAGYSIHAETVGGAGDKVRRADPFSVQVNWGNVVMVEGPWNHEFINELGSFPFSKWKDQVDAASAGFNKLALPAKKAGTW